MAICKYECIGCFQELGLGPFLKHPLVVHYFSVPSSVTEVFKITAKEIVYFLIKFAEKPTKKEINVEQFLDFIAQKKSVKSRELLGIRVQNVGYALIFVHLNKIYS